MSASVSAARRWGSDFRRNSSCPKKLWKVGDKLPTRVFGPYSVASLTTEWRAYLFTLWCGVHRRTDLDIEALGFTGPMAGKEQDSVLELENSELTDGAYIGPSRGY
jgi:hypothetical protein